MVVRELRQHPRLGEVTKHSPDELFLTLGLLLRAQVCGQLFDALAGGDIVCSVGERRLLFPAFEVG